MKKKGLNGYLEILNFLPKNLLDQWIFWNCSIPVASVFLALGPSFSFLHLDFCNKVSVTKVLKVLLAA